MVQRGGETFFTLLACSIVPNVASGCADSYFILPYFGQSERRGGLVGGMPPPAWPLAAGRGPEAPVGAGGTQCPKDLSY